MVKLKTSNKPLLIGLLNNSFVETETRQFSSGQTQVTLTESGVIVNVYDTGSVNIQGAKNEEVEEVIFRLIDAVEINKE